MTTEAEIAIIASTMTDLVDLAAEFFARLSPEQVSGGGWLGRDELPSDVFQALDRCFPSVGDEVRSFIAGPDIVRRSFSILSAVDYLVGTKAHPARPPVVEDRWWNLYERLLLTGRYDRGGRTKFAVIPAPPEKKWTQRRLGEYLCFLTPLHRAVPRYLYVSGLERREPIEALVCPFPFSAAEAHHEEVRQGVPADPHYRIRHTYDKDSLQAVEESIRETPSADWVLLPELALRESDLQRILDAFHQAGAPEDSPTRALFCGFAVESLETLAVAGSRNAVAVEWRGGHHRTWLQAKVNSFDIDLTSGEKEGISLQAGSRYIEHLEVQPAPAVTVADTPFGRIMVAICEDAVHVEPSKSMAVSSGVEYFLVPVLNRRLEPGRWYHQVGQQLFGEPGAYTIVVTSAFLEQSRKTPEFPIAVVLVNSHEWESPAVTCWQPNDKGVSFPVPSLDCDRND